MGAADPSRTRRSARTGSRHPYSATALSRSLLPLPCPRARSPGGLPTQVARRLRPRAPGRVRRAGRARIEGERPVRSDTRGPPRTPRGGRPQSARATARAPRATPIVFVSGSAHRLRRGSMRGGTGTPRSHRRGLLRGDQVAPAKRHQVPADLARREIVDSSVTLPQWKTRPSTEPRSITRCSSGGAIQPRLEQSRHRWHGHVREIAGDHPAIRFWLDQAIVDQHRDHLLHEQRISFSGLHDGRATPRKLRPTEQPGDQLVGILLGEWFEEQCDGRRLPAPARPVVLQLWARRTHQEDRCVLVHSATCSIRSSNPGSAQWMSSNTATSGRSAASASKSLRIAQWVSSGDAVAPASPRNSARRSEAIAASFVSAEERFDLRSDLGGIVRVEDPGDGGEHLHDRPVRDAVAVGEAPAPHEDGCRGDRRGTPRPAALPDAGDAQDRRKDAGALPRGAVESLAERLELPRHVRPSGCEPRATPGDARDLGEPERVDRPRLPLQRER